MEAVTRKYTPPYSDVIRAKIVPLAAQGLENKKIGERLDVPRQMVSKWRKRFFEKRLAGLEECSRRGWPLSEAPSLIKSPMKPPSCRTP